MIAGGYIVWKIFVAAVMGLGRAGREITNSWPVFFEKVWQSLITGIVVGLIIGFFTKGDVTISSASGVGVALAKLGYDVFNG